MISDREKSDREITIEIMESADPNSNEDQEELFDVQTCRICGCTDDFACPGGCYWVEEDLCSSCVEEAYGSQKTGGAQ